MISEASGARSVAQPSGDSLDVRLHAAPAIEIRGARVHTLAGASCRIPLGSLTAITGVSGSGKSSLAFDTLYAEGQRRYVASLSTYARLFLERLPRPEVDSISHLPPAVAIERRNRVTNARSTVGSATEIVDHLRLLYAHAGETWCDACERRAQPGHVEAVARRISARFSGGRISLGAPLPEVPAAEARALREHLVREGYTRLLDATGAVRDVGELGAREFERLRGEGWLLVDRLAAGDDAASRTRIAEAVATAFERGGGRLAVVTPEGVVSEYLTGLACDGCGRRFPEPTAALFSWSSPLGACPTCQGFGRVAALDRERVVPDPRKTLAGGAISPFSTPSGRRAQAKLMAFCARAGVPVDVPVERLAPRDVERVFRGDGARWKGVEGFFARLERKRYKVQNRVQIARYRRFDPCPDCAGARLRPEALAVRVGGRDLAALCRLPLGELAVWLEKLDLSGAESARVSRLLADVRARVATAVAVGLDYVTLDRATRTLSGGEAQRIQLASALGGTLCASLYVLDEPSASLHARDLARLVAILQRIRDQGNTVVVVEHALALIGEADHVIELGPGAGRHGGRVVAEGDVASLRGQASPTGLALAGALDAAPRKRRAARGKLRIVGASAHNLHDVTVDVPLGQLVVVSGVSGAGKSTLVRSVLVGQLRRDPERGACTRVEGADALDEVVLVEAAPPARSPRSNPATVSKAFEPIRQRFAETREARARGATPGWFSFNVPGGRCEVCEGAGEIVVDMHFLDDLRMPCEACDGRRYRKEVLDIRLRGRSIVDVLGFSVDDALAFFAGDEKIEARLDPLRRVGLGYLSLGQPLSTLSGGEAQRLRIAQALHETASRRLFVFDEPTAGLHPADIRVLVGCLDELLAAGASVVVVEHDLDLIRSADWVIDMGPEAGPGGGRVVAEGPPEAIARAPGSHTGVALRALGRGDA
jgi:excinuclease ABC subunit A